jgi:hypothetical protein
MDNGHNIPFLEMGKEEFSIVFSVVCTLMKTLINKKKF